MTVLSVSHLSKAFGGVKAVRSFNQSLGQRPIRPCEPPVKASH